MTLDVTTVTPAQWGDDTFAKAALNRMAGGLGGSAILKIAGEINAMKAVIESKVETITGELVHLAGFDASIGHELARVRDEAAAAIVSIGERVTVIPIHICVAVNMQNHIWWDEGDGQLEKIPVDTRGMLS